MPSVTSLPLPRLVRCYARYGNRRPPSFKTRALWAPSILLCLLAAGCDSSKDTVASIGTPQRSAPAAPSAAVTGPRIVVMMEADRHYDRYTGPLGEYRIQVTIKNGGASAIDWDVAMGEFFFIGAAKTLRLPTRPAKAAVGRIAVGGSDVFEYVTDGYTRDLLDDARKNGKPLLFAMALQLGGKEIFPPHFVPLPPLVVRSIKQVTK
jgi:hypothetical protein